ncbi:MAG: 1-acyl-sn-glycerol-3-phosphate acyltransferase [Candidatus Omnitrophica bacterium]|nr:1-acyl-sn-glycerol-3-phosphate acyltransferase [Candidatus Omnitrophota bacterium]
MIYRIGRFICWIILKVFFKIQVKGRDVLPYKQPFILASNHISHLDPVVLGVANPPFLGYLGKEELFKHKLLGSFFKCVGVIPLERGKSDIKAMRTALKVLKEKPLVIFPQGSRSDDFDKFKTGVGFLYRRSGAPIIVAKIRGTDKILAKGSKWPKLGKIRVVFGKVEGISPKDDYDDIAKKVVEKIRSL